MNIEDLSVEIVRKNIKHLYLKVLPPDGKIRVVSPHKLDNALIQEFVIAKRQWIENKQQKYRARLPAFVPQYQSGEIHYYKGDRLILNVIETKTTTKAEVRSDRYLDLYVKYNSLVEQRELILTSWYRQQLKAELPDLIARWEKIIGVKTNDWGVKKMKTRWGSCNIRAKRIWLNLALIKKPPQCLAYVVVHELVHLLEPNHGDRFKAYMNQFMPEWQTCDALLSMEKEQLTIN